MTQYRILAALAAYLLLWTSVAEAAYVGTGTSGGLGYFNSSGTLTSSGAYTSNVILKGGGAGNPPAASSITDNGTTVSSSELLNWSGGATFGGSVTLSATVTSGSAANCLAETSAFLMITTACSGGASLTVGTTTITSGATNGVLYQAGSSLLGEIATANSSVFITSGAGVPSWATTLPSGLSAPSLTVTTAFTATGLVTAADLFGTSGSGGNVVLATGPSISGLTVTSSFTATGLVTTGDLATMASNTVLANATGSTASPTAYAMPSCSASNQALIWTAGTGFGCATGVTPSESTVTGASPFTIATTNDLTTVISMATPAASTVNLPATQAAGFLTCVKDGTTNFATNNATVKVSAGNIDNVAGTTGYVMNLAHQNTCFLSDGTNYWVE